MEDNGVSKFPFVLVCSVKWRYAVVRYKKNCLTVRNDNEPNTNEKNIINFSVATCSIL